MMSTTLFDILSEAFQKKGAPPSSGGASTPFPSKPPKKASPIGGQSPVIPKAEDASVIDAQVPATEPTVDENGQAIDPTDPMAGLLAAQQAKEEEEALEREMRAQKAKEEDAERLKTKELRQKAEAEVRDDLEDKYNDEADEIELYPAMIPFSQYNKSQEQPNDRLIFTAGEKVAEEDEDSDNDPVEKDDSDDDPVEKDDSDVENDVENDDPVEKDDSDDDPVEKDDSDVENDDESDDVDDSNVDPKKKAKKNPFDKKQQKVEEAYQFFLRWLQHR